MKLPIYEKKKIVKVYEATTYDLMFGTVEDILDILKLDKLQATTNEELLKEIQIMAIRSMGTLKGLLMDIFDGLTEEEIRKAKAVDIAKVLREVLYYAIAQIGGNEKN